MDKLKNTLKNYLNSGKQKEKELIDILSRNDLKTANSNYDQDVNEHWDFRIMSDIKVDVKSLKKDKRGNSYTNENIHWVELRATSSNSNKKRIGWLYSTYVDYFAFETNDYWIFVKKENLQNLISKKCKDKIVVDNPGDALYKLYTRKGRNDLLTKIKTLDLCYVSEFILEK